MPPSFVAACTVASLIIASAAVAQSPPPVQPPTTEPWRQPAASPATFGVLLSPGVAPAVIHVDGLRCPLPVGTPLTARYDWDFGDPAGKYNTLTGFNAAHLYDQPGAYTIRLTVTDEAGTVQTATANVVISPNRRRQLFVSSTGSDRNLGTSTAAPLQSLHQAFKDLTDGCEIRLKAGDTFAADSALSIRKSDVLIGRYDVGPDPVLMLSKKDGSKDYGNISVDSHCNGVLIERITVATPYGVDDNAEAPKVGIDSISPRGRNISIREVTFHNVDTAINSNGNPTGLLVQDCKSPDVTGLRAYLVWGQGTDHVYLGNTVVNSTREHCVRICGVDRVLVFGNDFTNLDRRPTDQYDVSKGTIEMQRGTYAWIAGNKAAHGTVRVGPLGLHEDLSTATDYAVIDGNDLTDAYIPVYPGSHHVMIRNNVIRRDDGGPGDAMAVQIQGPTKEGRSSGDIHVLHNTFIDPGADGTFIKVWGHTGGIELKNNLFVPNLVFGTNGAAAVGTQEEDLSSFTEIGQNVWPGMTRSGGNGCALGSTVKTAADWAGMDKVKSDIFADVTVDDRAAPAAGSAAVGAATAAGATVDHNGKHRPAGPVTAGAVEVGGNKTP